MTNLSYNINRGVIMSKKKKKKKGNIIFKIIVAFMALLMIASPIIAGLATVIKK